MIPMEKQDYLKWWMNACLSGNAYDQLFLPRHLKESSIYPCIKLQAVDYSVQRESLHRTPVREGLLVWHLFKGHAPIALLLLLCPSHRTAWSLQYLVLFNAIKTTGFYHAIYMGHQDRRQRSCRLSSDLKTCKVPAWILGTLRRFVEMPLSGSYSNSGVHGETSVWVRPPLRPRKMLSGGSVIK